jgi:hypothetical protein
MRPRPRNDNDGRRITGARDATRRRNHKFEQRGTSNYCMGGEAEEVAYIARGNLESLNRGWMENDLACACHEKPWEDSQRTTGSRWVCEMSKQSIEHYADQLDIRAETLSTRVSISSGEGTKIRVTWRGLSRKSCPSPQHNCSDYRTSTYEFFFVNGECLSTIRTWFLNCLCAVPLAQ